MKDYLSKINKVFENRVRLAVMSLLMVNERLDFNFLKSTLDLTDGNLASHIAKLEEKGYLEVEKAFVGKKNADQLQCDEGGKKSLQRSSGCAGEDYSGRGTVGEVRLLALSL